MDRETFEKLRERWPEKGGRSVDPGETRIDVVVFASGGHEYKPCKDCKGKGASGEPGKEKKCKTCKGRGRVAIYDALTEVSFKVERSWVTQGNRLILACESGKQSRIERTRIRKHEG